MWPTVLFALTWNVPCAPAPDVPALLGNAEGEAVVTVTPSGAQWHLEVAFPTAVRQLDAPTCEDAARAALLFLKLGATAQPDRAPVAAKPAPPAPPPPPPLPPPPEPPTPLVLRLSAGVLGNAGALPSVGPRLAVELGVSKGALAGFFAVRAGVPATFAGGPSTSAGFTVHPALGAQLSGCALFGGARVRGGPCAAVGVEWWRILGVNVDLPSGGSEAWVAAGLDGRLLVDVTARLFAFAAAGVRVSLRRPQVVFEGLGAAYTVPLVSGEGGLGLGGRW